MSPHVHTVVEKTVGQPAAWTIRHDHPPANEACHERYPVRSYAVTAMYQQQRLSTASLDNVCTQSERRNVYVALRIIQSTVLQRRSLKPPVSLRRRIERRCAAASFAQPATTLAYTMFWRKPRLSIGEPSRNRASAGREPLRRWEREKGLAHSSSAG